MDEEKIVLNFEENVNPLVIESVRALRNKLLLSDFDHKVMCFSSLYPKEGVTTIVRILALYLSDIQKKVIIVSADLKHRNTEISNSSVTLKDYLSGNCAFENIVKRVNANLDIIIGTNTNDDHSDLLYMNDFTNMIDRLKSEYDLVLIDAPSFSTASETSIISRMADSLVLVVKENGVKVNVFADLVKKLQKQNIIIQGVVLNRVTESENLEIQTFEI